MTRVPSSSAGLGLPVSTFHSLISQPRSEAQYKTSVVNDVFPDVSAIRLDGFPPAFRALAGIDHINPHLLRNVLGKNSHSSLMLPGFKGQESFILPIRLYKDASPSEH